MTRLNRARLFAGSLAGLALGLILTPLPWLALVVPSALLFAVAVIAPTLPEEGE